jgi:hypothetical protein
MSPPLGRNFQITGFKTQAEAADLIESFPQGKREAMAKPALLWLAAMDEGNYERSYELASEYFKTPNTKDRWIADRITERGIVGAFGGVRNLTEIKDRDYFPGMPEGEYRIIIFTTIFEKIKRPRKRSPSSMTARNGKL